MASGGEAPAPGHENIVEADFAAHRREIAYENSAFGPIQKWGKELIERAQGDGTAGQQSHTVDRYQPQHFSNQSNAIERTDLSDPKLPFIDF